MDVIVEGKVGFSWAHENRRWENKTSGKIIVSTLFFLHVVHRLAREHRSIAGWQQQQQSNIIANGGFSKQKTRTFCTIQRFFSALLHLLSCISRWYFSLFLFKKRNNLLTKKKNYNSSREVRVCVNQLVRLRKLNVKKRIYKKNKHGETRSEIMASRYVWLFILLTRIIHSVRFSTYSHNFAFFRINNIICLRILCVWILHKCCLVDILIGRHDTLLRLLDSPLCGCLFIYFSVDGRFDNIHWKIRHRKNENSAHKQFFVRFRNYSERHISISRELEQTSFIYLDWLVLSLDSETKKTLPTLG